MKILFMGTPDFAVASLQALIESSHDVVAVVTAPDKPRGRGQKISGTPVKELADMHHIPVLQPTTLKDAAFIDALKSFQADCFVVVAFRILPREVFTIPPKKTFNLHASLLPKYRGAAPINWAIMNGEHESGVTTFFIEDKVDTGNLLFQEAVLIGEDTTAGELHDALSLVGARLVVETADAIEEGGILAAVQDDALATPAPKIFKETCEIRWHRSAAAVHNHIRGLSPYPTAWTRHNGTVLKLYGSRPVDIAHHTPPGTVLVSEDTLRIACGIGAIDVLEIKQEGRKQMPVDAFLRGYEFREGETLG